MCFMHGCVFLILIQLISEYGKDMKVFTTERFSFILFFPERP